MKILDKPFKPIELNEALIEGLVEEFQQEAPIPSEGVKDLPRFFTQVNKKVSEAKDIGNLLYLKADAEKRLADFQEDCAPIQAYLENKDMYEEVSPEYAKKMDEEVSDLFIGHIVARSVVLITDVYISRNNIPDVVAKASVQYIKECL